MSKNTWNDEAHDDLAVYRLLLWPLGTWPLESKKTFPRMRSCITVLSQILTFSCLVGEIVQEDTNAGVKLDAVMLIICSSLATIKISSYQIFSNNLERNFSSAVKDYSTIENVEQRAVVHRHARIGKIACYSVMSFTYICLVMFGLSPILSRSTNDYNKTFTERSMELPAPSQRFLRLYLTITPVRYVILYLIELIFLFLTCNANLGSDSVFFGIMLHMCGQVEILKQDFASCKGEKAREKLRILTARHQELLFLSWMLIDAVSFILLMQLFVSCILICTMGFQVLLCINNGDYVMIWKALTVLLTFLTQLFAYCYVGDYLKCQLEDIQHAVHNCAWYDFPTSLMKNITFITMHAQTPVQLAAGHFFPVNMETYMKILKTSLSYLSVLRVMLSS